MPSNVQAYRVPEYIHASKRRVLSKYSALDYFVSEHEPRSVGNDQQVIERWRDDLSWCMVQAEQESDQRVADLRCEMEQEQYRMKNSLGDIILVLLGMLTVSILLNVTLYFKL